MKLTKKNYIYRILSALVLCIMIAGCGRSGNGKEEAEEEAVKEIELSEIPENMLAYWMVLNNKKPFVSMDEDKQRFYLNEYFWYLKEVTMTYHADYFMVVDMDGDGEEEVVLECDPGTSQVLHYEDGKVYSYQFGIRGMKRIHKNGIYDASDGAADNYFLRLTELNKDGYTEEMLAEMHGDYYEIEGKETTCDGFFDYVEKIESIGLAERMELAEETIDQQLLGNLMDQDLAFVKQLPKENMLENEPDYQEHKETLQLYRAALSGEEDINYVIMDTFPGDYDPLRVYFSIVDMDGDGEDELVFTRERGMIEILHYGEGQVYSYQFRPLKLDTAVITTDGVFQTEDDLSSTGYARITAFEKDGCKIEPVEDYESGSHERVRYYFYPEEAEKEPSEGIFYCGAEEYFYLLEGEWTAAEYAGAIRDYHFDEAKTEEYQKKLDEHTKEVVEKYLGTEYCIEINNLESLAPYSDFYIIMEDDQQLFGITRFMPGEFIKMNPPYITLAARLADEDKEYGFIIDAEGTVLIEIEYRFFRLEKKEAAE